MFGPEARDVLNSADSTTITIGAGATVYSKSFKLKFGRYFAIFYKAASVGAIDLTIELEESDALPTVEGAANVKYVVPAGIDNIDTNLADANWHAKSISPAPMPYGRLKITNASGVANTLQAKLSIQETMV